jgi:hypothetical protein
LDNSRTAVESVLGAPVLDHVWNALEEHGCTEDLELGLTTAGVVAMRARRISAALDDPPTQPEPYGQSEPVALKDPDLPKASEAARARIDALSVIYAAWAEENGKVRRYRDTVLARARAIMAAGAGTAAARPGRAGLLSENEVPGWVQWRYSADSPDGDGDRHVFGLVTSASPRVPRAVADLWYIADRQERVLTVDARGPLGQLAELAKDLSEEYRWRPSEAAMFVLTGWRPEVAVYVGSAQIRYNESSTTTRVTMALDPSLSAKDVAGIYGRLRQRFHPARPPRYQSVRRYRLAAHVGPHVQFRAGPPGSRPGPGRPPDPGPSGLVTFIEPVAGHSWQRLRHDWNARYGQDADDGPGRTWRYDSASNFIRDAKIALERLLFPGWTSRP